MGRTIFLLSLTVLVSMSAFGLGGSVSAEDNKCLTKCAIAREQCLELGTPNAKTIEEKPTCQSNHKVCERECAAGK